MAKQENKPKQENKEFVNPFTIGITYADFIEALGTESIKDYCKDNLSGEQIEWLEIEINNYKNK